MSQSVFSKNKISYKSFLLLIIIYFIGFQQFPVIRIGGSYKVYEIVATFLFFLYIIKPNLIKIASKESLLLFLFLLVSPLISYIIFNFNLEEAQLYYNRFPDAYGFRYDYKIAPFIILIYFTFTWVAINEIIKSKYIYFNIDKIIKVTVYIGTAIAIYSLYSAIFTGVLGFTDPLKLLPNLIQNKTNNLGYGLRSGGLSQEPSFYVLYQGWIVLFLLYIKNTFSFTKRYLLLFINILSLLLTFSSALVAFILIGLIYFIQQMKSIKRIVVFSFFTVSLFFILYVIIEYYSITNLIEYVLINKINNFINFPNHTLDSGAFRSYTSLLGLEIFKDYPFFGVGPGCSNFFMHLYEKNIYVSSFGEELNHGIFPQSSYSKVLAEQGLFGFILMILFFIISIFSFYKNRKKKYIIIFFYGSIFTFLLLSSIGPIYSMFIWVFIALGLNIKRGYYYNEKKYCSY